MLYFTLLLLMKIELFDGPDKTIPVLYFVFRFIISSEHIQLGVLFTLYVSISTLVFVLIFGFNIVIIFLTSH